jgi:methylornithine synthase
MLKGEELFAAAREARSKHFGDAIFLYGFVYFSTFCKNNCNFCYYRKDNKIRRYRKNVDEVFETAKTLVDSGVSLIDLTTGEDLLAAAHAFKEFSMAVHRIKSELGVPVMVSPGATSNTAIRHLADAGADFYALYQETHSRRLFSLLRIGQDYDKRFNAKIRAHEAGMLIEEGIMIGVGETAADRERSLNEMGRIGADQIRAMSFVPQQGSPMENREQGDRAIELEMIARMRLRYPDVLIPASLDVDGLAGLKDRLNAGANVITSIIPPFSGYLGVANTELDIDEGGRTADEAVRVLSELGLRRGETSELIAYIDKRKALL